VRDDAADARLYRHSIGPTSSTSGMGSDSPDAPRADLDYYADPEAETQHYRSEELFLAPSSVLA
jgi:hypothetical protein